MKPEAFEKDRNKARTAAAATNSRSSNFLIKMILTGADMHAAHRCY
jgi:hypothetical protein